ncbi:MAG TPA: hypothetical protein VFA80_17470 [Xanthobacteraceae bacterium]|nr:hypothetical protein [Xanthobacteraceae bacterium]
MATTFRRATEADAEPIASLLTELGYAPTAADVSGRMQHALHSETSWLLLAQSRTTSSG